MTSGLKNTSLNNDFWQLTLVKYVLFETQVSKTRRKIALLTGQPSKTRRKMTPLKSKPL